MDNDDLLPLRDVERKLGVSRWTLYEMIRTGKLPAVKLASGHYRVKASIVEATRTGVPEAGAPEAGALAEWHGLS